MSVAEVLEPGVGAGPRAGLDEYADMRAGLPARRPVETFSTGLGDLDQLLGGGLRRREYTVVLGATGANKSAFCEQIGLEVAKHHRVAHFALELGKTKTTPRLLAKLMRLDALSIENLLASRPDHKPLQNALLRLAYEHKYIIEERDRIEPFEWGHLLSLAMADKPDLLIIDDLQCIDGWNDGFPPRGSGKDWQPAQHPLKVRNEIITGICALAETLDCHVLIPHQTRAETIRKGDRPGLGDCADTPTLARRADTVLALHRPFRGDLAKDTAMELLIRKNRNGPECITHLYRVGKQFRFEEMTPAEEAELECCKPKKARR